MNVAPLFEAYAELRALVEADHVPVGVKEAALRLSECQKKLFVTVFVVDLAEGTTDGTIRFEPSNCLLELLAAANALDWPLFVVLVHDALSGDFSGVGRSFQRSSE